LVGGNVLNVAAAAENIFYLGFDRGGFLSYYYIGRRFPEVKRALFKYAIRRWAFGGFRVMRRGAGAGVQ
jgi:hypothetical protein